MTFAASLALLLASCENHPKTEQSKPNYQQTPSNHFQLTADQVKRNGVEWGAVESRVAAASLQVSGQLCIHPEHRATVVAPGDGFITDIRVTLNQAVRKGDVLAVLRNPDLVDLQNRFLENRARIAPLQANRDRFAARKKGGATAKKSLQNAEAELRTAQATDQLLATELRQYNIDPDQLTPTIVRAEVQIFSPLNGQVTTLHLNAGSTVKAGTPICDVSDLSALHADLFVLEKDILKIKNGQQAEITFPDATGQTLNATVFSIDGKLDSLTTILRIHARFENPAGLVLTDGASIEARLALDTRAPLMVIPADGIVREGAQEYILIVENEQNGGASFKALQVKAFGTTQGFTTFEPVIPLPAEAKAIHKGAYFVWLQGKTGELSKEK